MGEASASPFVLSLRSVSTETAVPLSIGRMYLCGGPV